MQQTHTTGARRWPLAIAVGALSATVAFTATGVTSAAAGGDRGDGVRDQGKAKNAILFIGDGMGTAHRNAGALATVGLDGDLVMDSLPYAGLVQTDAADPEGFITDSEDVGGAIGRGLTLSADRRLAVLAEICRPCPVASVRTSGRVAVTS